MRAIRRSFVLLIGLVVLASCNFGFGETKLHGAVFQQPRQLDFELVNVAEGKPMRSADLDGQAALVFFGYTLCPDICPTTMAEFKQVKDQLGNQADQVRFLMITVDPERDTPERLAKYVASFDPSFIGLRGEPDVTQQLLDSYGIVAKKREVSGTSAGYLVDHTALAFLLDKEGRMRTAYPMGTDPKEIAADVQAVLRE